MVFVYDWTGLDHYRYETDRNATDRSTGYITAEKELHCISSRMKRPEEGLRMMSIQSSACVVSVTLLTTFFYLHLHMYRLNLIILRPAVVYGIGAMGGLSKDHFN